MDRDSVAAEVESELGNSLHYRTTFMPPMTGPVGTYELFTTFLRGRDYATTSVRARESWSNLRPSWCSRQRSSPQTKAGAAKKMAMLNQ